MSGKRLAFSQSIESLSFHKTFLLTAYRSPLTAMSLLVTGSLAYDHLLEYKGLFSDLLLKDKLNQLNVCFYAPEKEICFGGCAGNIAYSLKLFEADFILYGRAGKDFGEYLLHFKNLGINTDYIAIDEKNYTATAYITTDKGSNQITTFAPGLTCKKAKVDFKKFAKEISFAIISPENADYMISVRDECIKYKIPYLFDPGQQLPTLSEKELNKFVKNAYITVTNTYEWELLSRKINIDKNYLIKNKINFIITHSENGSELIEDGKVTIIKAFKAKKIVNPTGCGDAYRAGVLFGLSKKWSLKKSCELGARIAAKVIEHRGTQEHKLVFSI